MKNVLFLPKTERTFWPTQYLVLSLLEYRFHGDRGVVCLGHHYFPRPYLAHSRYAINICDFSL